MKKLIYLSAVLFLMASVTSCEKEPDIALSGKTKSTESNDLQAYEIYGSIFQNNTASPTGYGYVAQKYYLGEAEWQILEYFDSNDFSLVSGSNDVWAYTYPGNGSAPWNVIMPYGYSIGFFYTGAVQNTHIFWHWEWIPTGESDWHSSPCNYGPDFIWAFKGY